MTTLLRRSRITRPLVITIFAALAMLVTARPAAAQPASHEMAPGQPTPRAASGDSRRWEIAVHAGGIRSSHPTAGATRLPDPGEPFATALGQSRRVSSWFFGDGAALLNQASTSLPLFRPRESVVPLDPVLNSASARRRDGASVGISVIRHVTPRIAAQVSVDYAPGSVSIDPAALATIEASRASAGAALSRLIFIGGFATNMSASVRERGGRLVTATGVVNIDVATSRRLVPYFTLGGGLQMGVGNGPAATLQGVYSLPSLLVINGVRSTFTETDSVTIRYVTDARVPVVLLGGGVRWPLSSRWTLRAEARGQFNRDPLSVTVDATPQPLRSDTPGAGSVLAIATTPPIQLSTGSSNSLSPPTPSTLSGPALKDFVTFDGTGLQRHFTITTGLSFRF